MKHVIAPVLLLASLLGATSAFARGGNNDPFKIEVDCDGIYLPGDVVTYLITVEDRVLATHPVDFTLELAIPGLGTRTLRAGSTTITPNQTTTMTFNLRLPARAPNGRYTLMTTGTSPTFTSLDTCSFQVQ